VRRRRLLPLGVCDVPKRHRDGAGWARDSTASLRDVADTKPQVSASTAEAGVVGARRRLAPTIVSREHRGRRRAKPCVAGSRNEQRPQGCGLRQAASAHSLIHEFRGACLDSIRGEPQSLNGRESVLMFTGPPNTHLLHWVEHELTMALHADFMRAMAHTRKLLRMQRGILAAARILALIPLVCQPPVLC
jgi:hypothetical protein